MAIIHSYSESSYLGRPGVGRSTLPWMAISQIAALTAHISFLLSELIFGTPGVGRSSCPSNGDYRFLLQDLIFGWPSVGRYTPLLNAVFTDSCFDHSYSIPNLRTHIWLTKCWQIYPHQMAISQIAALTAHISLLLSELIFGTPGVGRSSPHQMAIVDSYSESSYLADQVLADIPPCWMLISQILLWQFIFHSYSGELIFGWPNVGRSTPIKWLSNRLLLWQPIFHSYCESSYLSDQVLAVYPPSNGNFTDCCSDISYFIPTPRAHIWLPKCFQIYPHIKHQFHRFCSDNPYFIPTLRLIFGRPNVGRSNPPLNSNFTDSILTAHISFLL